MTTFLQFGTSRFLQAHADLIIDEALGPNQVCVVQSSGNPATASRLKALCAEEGYPVRIRGISDNQEIDCELRVKSIATTLSTNNDWDAVKAKIETCDVILSNVSEKGYVPNTSDKSITFDNTKSYPAKLLMLLVHRFETVKLPLTIMPLELFEKNGEHLKKIIIELAHFHHHSPEFTKWLNTCFWINSLVDRIVSEPIEPAGAIAEPYALWAIEKQSGWECPLDHPSITLVDDLVVIQNMKLFILNLGHTFMAHKWNERGFDLNMTVRAYLSDVHRESQLLALYENEVIPTFKAANLEQQAKDYCRTTMERFKNPFLDHKLADIYGGHQSKVTNRMGGLIEWAATLKESSAKPSLSTIITETRN